jgi:hypothetical protein
MLARTPREPNYTRMPLQYNNAPPTIETIIFSVCLHVRPEGAWGGVSLNQNPQNKGKGESRAAGAIPGRARCIDGRELGNERKMYSNTQRRGGKGLGSRGGPAKNERRTRGDASVWSGSGINKHFFSHSVHSLHL